MSETEEVTRRPAYAGAPTKQTGIEIDRIVLSACEFIDRQFLAVFVDDAHAEASADGDDGADLTTEVGVWIGEDVAFVRLRVSVVPKAQPSWAAMVEYVGRYSAGSNPVLPLEKFAWNNGIAYLVPFIREKLISLTAGSVYTTYVLPPVSVPHLIQLAQETEGLPRTASDPKESTPTD